MSKKVISFSLWGDLPNYNIGAIRNAELAKKNFPGWICRYYVDENSVPKETMDTLRCFDNVEIINEGKGDWTGMFWRFYTAADPDVDIMISRDVDSRVSERDAIAVNEWLDSGKSFHIIRDHPHHGYKILGGLWGVRGGKLRNMMQLIGRWQKQDRKQTDQQFLAHLVYPIIRNDCFIHDIFFCWEGQRRRISHDRVNYEHLGEYIDENEQQSPPHCRDLKNWIDKHKIS